MHHFLLRVIDPVDVALPASSCTLLIARGPFELGDEMALLQQHAIACVVSKNAGGTDTFAKLEAARQLQIPVIMVERPRLPAREKCETPQQAIEWLKRWH